jgi:23S rRNA pseudouridine2457 synthase
VLIAFNKPFGVLSQFTTDGSANRTLSDFSLPKNVYPLGRLDADSEGLLLLSNEPGLNTQLLDPKRRHPRIYWAQVERVPSPSAISQLQRGPVIQGRKSEPCRARLIHPDTEPPPRNPPIRFRKNVPTAWLELELTEGKNRQVRRMTAAIGHPTLRLIRVQIGRLTLPALPEGSWRELNSMERDLIFAH